MAALALLGAGAAATIGLTLLDGHLLSCVPFVTAGFSIASVYLWVTAK